MIMDWNTINNLLTNDMADICQLWLLRNAMDGGVCIDLYIYICDISYNIYICDRSYNYLLLITC